MSSIISRIVVFFRNLFGGSEVEEQSSAAQESASAPESPKRRHRSRHKSHPAGEASSQVTAAPQQDSRPPRASSPHPQKPAQQKQQPSQKQTESKPQGPRKPQPKVVDLQALESWEVPAGVKENDSDVLFQDLNLDKPLLKALLDDMGFKRCSPIQAQALPHALAGEDLAGKAQTGTGKTAAFLITVLERFLHEDKEAREPWQPLSVILAPTRELALQIAEDAENISAYCPNFKTVAVYGGMDYDKQMTELAKGVDLVVATPGRLIDYLHKHAVDLKAVKIAVIDEADRMLDMGFIPDVKRIMAYLPEPAKRQTMLFSATLSHDIMALASRWMRPSPTVIEIEPEHVLAEGIEETVYAATSAEKIAIMLWLFAHEDCHRVLIFRNRKKDVEVLHDILKRCDVRCEMLTGDVEQKKRLKILDDFKEGRVKIVVATDVAGRGIHVDDITHVINYDFPYEAEDYVHRVGRTARAGHKGRAISFADEDSAFVIPDIEKYIERPLPITQPSEEMLVMPEKYKHVTSPHASGSHRSSYRRY